MGMTGMYRFADCTVQICSLHEQVQRQCAEYRAAEGPADLCIAIAQSDIDAERTYALCEDEQRARMYTDAYLEGIAVYRKIAEQMPSFDTVLMHGSCVAVDGEGYLFSAKSGTGKSTHTRLWREVFGDRAVMINDDKPLIRIADGGAVIYGTPWNGKHHLGTNCGVPLRAICLLERAEQNCIRRITAAEAYPYLVQQIYRPADAAAMRKTVQLIDRLSGSVALWRLGCNMDPEAARVAYQAMKGPRP